jgi:hypothetical protein
MKKLLLGSIVLSAFSVSVALFQISCNKTSNAQSSNPTTTQNKFVYLLEGGVTGAGSDNGQIWIANLDGTGAQQINITMPYGYVTDGVGECAPIVTSNGTTIIFQGYNSSLQQHALFSCGINGGSAIKIKDIPKGLAYLGNAF